MYLSTAGAARRESCPQVMHTVWKRLVGRRRSCLRESVILFDPAGQLGHLVIDRSALFHQLSDLFVRVHHCGVVTIAEQLANLGQR